MTLDVNGGDELHYNPAAVVCNDIYITLPTPTRMEHTFDGWYTEKNESIATESIVKTLSNHTLYAHWSINNYTLTFIFGNGTDPEVRALEFNQTIIYPADPVREGYSFDRWDRNITNMPADNINITAQWIANKYTVAFNPSGGSVSQSTKDVTFGDTYGNLPTPNRTGHTFLGWLTEKNESITVESIVNITENHTLYAHWSINEYTLTFNFDNGTGPDVQVLEFNEEITYPADPVRVGYSFISWDRNITNMPADNTTITALWRANNYTVTFNPSEGSISRSTKIVAFGSAYGDLPTPNRTEHTFLGWFTEKNESITAESIVKIPDNHTLYAHWLEITQGQVEIIFSTKDMGKEEIEKIIKKYTTADFTIALFENDADEVRVIVEFVDAEEAKNFIEIVEVSSDIKTLIRKVGPIWGGLDSFSPAHHPMSLLYLI